MGRFQFNNKLYEQKKGYQWVVPHQESCQKFFYKTWRMRKNEKTRTIVNQDRQHDDNKQDNKITNPTHVKLTRNELELLNLGYKYNFPSINSTHIKQNMIAEAQQSSCKVK